VFDLARAIAAGDSNNRTARFVNDDTKVTPTKLDLWWISFFATGDEKYLALILKQTRDSRPQGEQPRTNRVLVAGAAKWSFQANCRQHAAVRRFAKNAMERDEWASSKQFLQQCVGPAKN
jgi:hypothetical protein